MDCGYRVYVPHLSHYLHMGTQRSYDEWMAISLDWMRRCDCVVRLRGASKGSDIECEESVRLKMPCFIAEKGEVAWHRLLDWLEDVADSREVRAANER